MNELLIDSLWCEKGRYLWLFQYIEMALNSRRCCTMNQTEAMKKKCLTAIQRKLTQQNKFFEHQILRRKFVITALFRPKGLEYTRSAIF